MSTKNEIKGAFSFIASDYNGFMEATNHLKVQQKIIELLQGEIKGEVLDVATGTGAIAISVAKTANAAVTAVDFSEKMIEKARKNAEASCVDVNFLVGDAERLLFPDAKFDVVICCLGMLWFVKKEAALGEMARICKDKGKIILIEEEGKTTRSRSSQKTETQESVFNERLQWFFSKIEKLETPISLAEIEKKMVNLNFKLTKKVKARIDDAHGFVGMVFAGD